MNPQSYWQSYVGDVSPGQFMYDYGSRNPEESVARHMSKLPVLYGIVRQLSWADSFRDTQHSREEVASALIAHLEDTRELWEETVSQMPEQAWPRNGNQDSQSADGDTAGNDKDPKQDHPQRIAFPDAGPLDACAHLSRDQGGLPREHTAKETPVILGQRPINTGLDQHLSIEQSIARSTPMYHAPEQELPLGTAVDQDLPLEKRPDAVAGSVPPEAKDETEAEAAAPEPETEMPDAVAEGTEESPAPEAVAPEPQDTAEAPPAEETESLAEPAQEDAASHIEPEASTNEDDATEAEDEAPATEVQEQDAELLPHPESPDDSGDEADKAP